MDSQTLKELGDVFLKISQMEDIIKSGERIITNLYRGVPTENLNVLRYKKFATKVVTSREVILIHTLPPTTEAAVYHDLRVYYQVQICRIGGPELDACEFGWFINNDKMMPIKTKNRPAPEKLLSIIRCNCKTNSETRRCSCRKHGLECNISCGECRGQNCLNSKSVEMGVLVICT